MNTRLLGPPSCSFGFTCHVQRASAAAVRLRVPPARAADTSSSQSVARLRAVLEQVDGALSQGNDEAALSLVRGSQGKDGGLRGFGAARQVRDAPSCLDFFLIISFDALFKHTHCLLEMETQAKRRTREWKFVSLLTVKKASCFDALFSTDSPSITVCKFVPLLTVKKIAVMVGLSMLVSEFSIFHTMD
jgi:hypothetical protein